MAQGHTRRAAPGRACTKVEPRPTLVAYGAPLFWKPVRQMPLEEAVAHALQLLAEDPALFLSLPVVLAMNADHLDGQALVSEARRLGATAELGMLLSLTGELSGNQTFERWADECRPVPDGRPRYLTSRMSPLGLAAADRNTARVVATWGFRANLPDSSFRQFFDKHCHRPA